MRIYNQNTDSSEIVRGGVAAIGNFDGVHLGHRHLIQNAIDYAAKNGAAAGIMTFDPHPRRFFNPDEPPFRLSSKGQTVRILKSLGADFLAFEPFNAGLASLSPEEFVSDILVQKYGFSCVIVGFNFRFGHKRAGDAEMLRDIGRKYGVDVVIIPPVKGEQTLYASSHIRDHIRQGDLDRAQQMLGWRWEIDGPVLHGDKRGRELGYPTANQSLQDYLRPPFGVYAVRATLQQDDLNPTQWMHGVANLGVRPMFKLDEPLLETYIFDFNNDIYDQNLRVELIYRLRGERAFANVEELVEQMHRDETAARKILSDLK